MTKRLARGRQQNKEKKERASSQVNKLWSRLFLGGMTAVGGTLGALSALLLAATPLKHGQFHLGLAHKANSLGSILPVTLTRPVNILVLGIDNSGHPHKDLFTPKEAMAGNSDTMLLVRLMPDTHKINILSIPRDTLVEMPGKGIDKINDANVRGGAELAEKTVSHLLSDVPIDYYIRLDTEGFIQLVDALGGVELTVPKSMRYKDATQKLFIDFQAGRQKLNGQHLEEYVRFRDDKLGDIGRVQRQQEVLKAILDSVLRTSTLGRLPQLIQVVKNNVDTDVSVGMMLAIADFLAHTNQQQINLLMLPGRFSHPDEYPLSYWIENPEAAAPILARYFDVHNDREEAIADTTSSRQLLRVAILNGTGRSEEAEKTMTFLKKQGFDNSFISTHEIDSDTIPLSKTQIIAQKGNIEAAEAVKSALGLGQVQVASTGDLGSDVTVIVGTDLTGSSLFTGSPLTP